jgi:hypothetical protein
MFDNPAITPGTPGSLRPYNILTKPDIKELKARSMPVVTLVAMQCSAHRLLPAHRLRLAYFLLLDSTTLPVQLRMRETRESIMRQAQR